MAEQETVSITTKDLMSVLGCGKNLVTELERSGVIRRSGKNTWDRDGTLCAYIAHLRSQAKQTQPTGTTLVSMEAFGRHIGVSRERVRALVAEGVIAPASDGRIDQDRARIAYLTHLRDRPQRSQAADKLREAKAIAVEMRTAREAHDLIETDEALAVVEDQCGIVLTVLGGLSARVAGRDLTLRRKIEDVIYELRTAMADRLREQLESLRRSGKATAAPPSYGRGDRSKTSPGPEDEHGNGVRIPRP